MPTSKVYFDRKEIVPDDQRLKIAFGLVYPAYKEIVTLIETYPREWKFYGPKYGWQLKVSHKGKALVYLTPVEGSFRLGFALRDNEKEALLNSKLPAKAKEELRAAKRYPEGYPLRLQVRKENDVKVIRLVVDTLRELRR